MSNIREMLLASKPKIVETAVEGVAEPVRIREMRYGEFRALLEDEQGDGKVIASCLVDENGGPCLTLADVDALPMSIKRELVKACIEANGGKLGN